MQTDTQFYPTPRRLAQKMWSKFKNQNFRRILEPSAGNGDLLKAYPRWDVEHYRGSDRKNFDVVEIDISRHPTLQALGVNVVGLDFMQYRNAAAYSHCIMNPPFAQGCKQVLWAWELLFDAEIVAIVNAETVKNPFTAERKQLVRLIEQHGTCDIMEDTFLDPDTQRKTTVEIALIYLCKQADAAAIVTEDLLDDLKVDSADGASLAKEYARGGELALPANLITNAVASFDAAVRTMKLAVVARAKANYYAAQLGQTMAVMNGDTGKCLPGKTEVKYVQEQMGSQYEELKDRAWAHILHSSNVTEKLSSGARKRILADFEKLKKLEFTTANIYSFLQGILDSQTEIQMGMLLDVFDLISKYHNENTCFYRGWKSNGKHRSAGMRVKTTRFVLPGFGCDTYLSCENEARLRDFDRVFSMLDGKSEPAVSLVSVFKSKDHGLLHAQRVSTTYFDVRWFRGGAGTVHFFPKSKALMDTLNRWVGRARQWLPPDTERVVPDFMQQYEQAEKFDTALRKELGKVKRRYWEDPLDQIVRGRDEDGKAMQELDAALAKLQASKGIDIDRLLTDETSNDQQLLLLAA